MGKKDAERRRDFGPASFAIRLIVALLLVLLSYNPTGISWFDWLQADLPGITPLVALTGVALLIGWVIYIRATLRSLGTLGLILAFAFFGALLWLVIDAGIVPADSVEAITWIVLVLLSLVMAVGISWSHVRRRLTGQYDTDELDG
ncbi:MAG: DUF6524 family protein [Gammaproteobacteria bacterium]|jgi:hypothetical protein